MSEGDASLKSGVDEKREIEKNKYAWVTLVMLGDAYIPGALVLASSLRKVKTIHDIAIMVTKDVSEQARDALSKVFDNIIEVEYIVKATTYPRTEKQKKLYSWVDKSLTKWNCLLFTKWTRVIFLDADIVILQNMDDLFKLNPPAGCFSSPWAYPYSSENASSALGTGRKRGPRNGIMNPYLEWYRHNNVKNKKALDIPHGTVLPAGLLLKSLTRPTFTVLGAIVLLRTGEDKFKHLMKTAGVGDDSVVYGSGHKLVANTAEEAAIVEATTRKGISWTHIHQKYEAVPRKPDWTKKIPKDEIKAFHYLGSHPWTMSRHEWPDLEEWWEEADAFTKQFPEMKKWFEILPAKFHEKKDDSAAATPLDVRITVKSRGGGVFIDAMVLREALLSFGRSVTICVRGDSTCDEKTRAKTQIFIEGAGAEFRNGKYPADSTYLLVNHEFLSEWDVEDMKGKQGNSKKLIPLCKTREAMRVLESIGVTNAIYIGFTSPDVQSYKNSQEAIPRIVHLAGGSPLKNTANVIDALLKCRTVLEEQKAVAFVTRYDSAAGKAAADLKQWDAAKPEKGVKFTLGDVVISDLERIGPIILCRYQLPDTSIDILSQSDIHLCPSLVEGFGHIINQGRRAAAIVITTDAPPMNELIDAKCGVPLSGSPGKSVQEMMPWLHLQKEQKIITSVVSADAISDAIHESLGMSSENAKKLGDAARKRYEADRKTFLENVKKVFAVL